MLDAEGFVHIIAFPLPVGYNQPQRPGSPLSPDLPSGEVLRQPS